MRTFGIIGNPLGHSFSRKYFTDKFAEQGIKDAVYENFPIEEIAELPALVDSCPTLAGLNVTIPYKEKVIPYLDALSPEAARIGAVNCISFDGGKLTGHNTDIDGFRDSLLDFIGKERPAALVLGTGGASKAVHYVLEELGIDALAVSRTEGEQRLSYGRLDRDIMESRPLIVNTTPLGTFPDTAARPDIPYQWLTPSHFLFDLVYNPPVTRFMELGAAQGARTRNGYGMLVGQAESAWRIWNR